MRRAVARMGPAVKEQVQRLTHYQPLPQYNRPDDPSWRLMKAILLEWTRELRAPAVIFPIPIYHYVEETASSEAYRARFAELDRPPQVTVHDPLPDLLDHPRPERRAFRYELDCHPTPAMHRVWRSR